MMRRSLFGWMSAAAMLFASGSRADEVDVEGTWKKHCVSCHGADGQAHTTMGRKLRIESFADARWQSRHSDAFIRRAITDGLPKTRMESFRSKLTDAQIEALVQRIRGFAPAPAKTP